MKVVAIRRIIFLKKKKNFKLFQFAGPPWLNAIIMHNSRQISGKLGFIFWFDQSSVKL